MSDRTRRDVLKLAGVGIAASLPLFSTNAFARPAKDIEDFYREYLNRITSQDWDGLRKYVTDDVSMNGTKLGATGFSEALAKVFNGVTGLKVKVEFLVIEPTKIGARLIWTATPAGAFLEIAANGKTVSYPENIFYKLENGKIAELIGIYSPPEFV